MKSTLASWTVVAILASSTAARPQAPPGPTALGAPGSFGLGDQVLHIPAAAFQPQGNAAPSDFRADGYLGTTGIGFWAVAPLALPAGARVFAICTYFYGDSDFPFAFSLRAVKLAAGAVSPEVVTVAGPVTTDDSGYEVACTSPSYTYRDTQDVDGDGTVENVVHQLEAFMSQSSALGGVRVFWRHQVSPAPALPSFSDVAPSDPAFTFIEAARAAGVTAGCAGGRYCPDGVWTRRQMAMFLAKALGLYWH